MRSINNDIRKYARERGVFLYEVAKRLGLNDGNFSRLLRFELPDQKRAEIIGIIDDLTKKRQQAQ